VVSHLAQDYQDCEVIVVNDRSSDRTGAILDAMSGKAPRLTVVHVRELPKGWLGKNHALHVGAQRANGDILLFVDGDIVIERSTVSRAMRLLEANGADHIAVSPQLDLPSWPLQLVALYFLTWGVVLLRVWRVSDPRSSASVGIGAFNLIRRSAYDAIGGHTRIQLRPDDDLMLGKLLKQSGARQLLAFGQELVSVEWYRSLREATLGFRKNAFAVLGYSLTLFAAGITANLALSVWPFVAIFLTDGVERTIYATASVALCLGFARTAAAQRMPMWLTLFYPAAALGMTVMLVVAVARTIRAGGIDWRGTFYPLADLRANRV
jgi:glycosyltransferase involved in cell wall biosynthesis